VNPSLLLPSSGTPGGGAAAAGSGMVPPLSPFAHRRQQQQQQQTASWHRHHRPYQQYQQIRSPTGSGGRTSSATASSSSSSSWTQILYSWPFRRQQQQRRGDDRGHSTRRHDRDRRIRIWTNPWTLTKYCGYGALLLLYGYAFFRCQPVDRSYEHVRAWNDALESKAKRVADDRRAVRLALRQMPADEEIDVEQEIERAVASRQRREEKELERQSREREELGGSGINATSHDNATRTTTAGDEASEDEEELRRQQQQRKRRSRQDEDDEDFLRFLSVLLLFSTCSRLLQAYVHRRQQDEYAERRRRIVAANAASRGGSTTTAATRGSGTSTSTTTTSTTTNRSRTGRGVATTVLHNDGTGGFAGLQRQLRNAQFQLLADRLNDERLRRGQRPISAETLRIVLASSDRQLGSGENYDDLLRFVEEQQQQQQQQSDSVRGATEEEIGLYPSRILQSGDDLLLMSPPEAEESGPLSIAGGHQQDAAAGASQSGPVNRNININSNSSRDQCVICLERFRVGDEIRTISCTHAFHRGCVDPWLRQKAICPICKHPL